METVELGHTCMSLQKKNSSVHLLNKSIIIISMEKLVFFYLNVFPDNYSNYVHQYFVQTANLCFLFFTPFGCMLFTLLLLSLLQVCVWKCDELFLSKHLQWIGQNIFTRFWVNSEHCIHINKPYCSLQCLDLFNEIGYILTEQRFRYPVNFWSMHSLWIMRAFRQ